MKPLQPCGTNAAYARHRLRGEKACQPCLDAHNAVSRAQAAKDGPRRPWGQPPEQLCGTASGYKRHTRLREQPCEPCREAKNRPRRATGERRPYRPTRRAA